MNTEIKWYGWDSFLIKFNGCTIYIDPLFGEYVDPADVVLISHSHRDHCNPEALAQIRNKNTIVLTSKENENNVSGIGLSPGENYQVNDIKITACHAYNINRKRDTGVPFHPKGFGVGWMISHSDKNIYFMGDTELIPEMESINNVDVLLIPVSGKFVMDVDEAIEAIKLIKPKVTIPMHYGIVDGAYGGKTIYIELNIDTEDFKNRAGKLTDLRVLHQNETTEV
jgi:L-ascorbate metabolism protein UlaG (beta-lactamase superfamily)